MNDEILRIIDANLNRASEGMRVLEETARLVWNDPVLSADLKDLRHAVADVFRNDRDLASRIMRARDSSGDVFRTVETESERSRPDLYSLVRANARRAAEAVRALEEYGKLVRNDVSGKFKCIRFRLYDVEKRLFERLESMRRMKREQLSVIVSVDRAVCRIPPEECALAAAQRGAGAILYRDAVSRDRLFMENLSRIVHACRLTEALVFAADRADAVLAADADGVVAGDSDMPVEICRTIVGNSRVIGRSFGGAGLAKADAACGADFLMVTFPSRIAGDGDAMQVMPDPDIPVVAVIDPRHTDGREEKKAGASGFCVFAEHMNDSEMESMMKSLRAVLK